MAAAHPRIVDVSTFDGPGGGLWWYELQATSCQSRLMMTITYTSLPHAKAEWVSMQ